MEVEERWKEAAKRGWKETQRKGRRAFIVRVWKEKVVSTVDVNIVYK